MKILKGTLIGGVLFFFMGWLIWGILLSGFMAENTNQAFNRPENEMVWWSLILSNLLLGLLMTLVLKWAGVTTVKGCGNNRGKFWFALCINHRFIDAFDDYNDNQYFGYCG